MGTDEKKVGNQSKEKKETKKENTNEKMSIFEKAKKKDKCDSGVNNESNKKHDPSKQNTTQNENVKETLDNKPKDDKKVSIFDKAKRKKPCNSDVESDSDELNKKKGLSEKVKKEENVPKSSEKKLSKKARIEEDNEEKKTKTTNDSRKKSIERDNSRRKSKDRKPKTSDLHTESENEEEMKPHKRNSEKKNKDRNPSKEKADEKLSKGKKDGIKKDKNEEDNSEKQSGKNTPKQDKPMKKQKNHDAEDKVKDQPEKVEPKPENAKKNKRKSDYDFASESESEEEVEEQKKLMAELRQFFKDNNIQLKPRAPTRGDGNCFFRSVADQIILHKISDKPTTHRELRLAVCNHIKDLPKDVLQSTVDIIYKGKRRGLADLAHRQRKLGQFVDDYGIMVMSTALFLNRDIEVYSAHASGNQGHSVTKIDGGEGADKLPPLTIFYFKDYQHYQTVGTTGKQK